MFSSTFKSSVNNNNNNNSSNTINNNDFTKPLISLNSNIQNSSAIDLGDNSKIRKINSLSGCSSGVSFNDKIVEYSNCLPELNIQRPKHSNLKAKIYNFLERPTGW